MAVRIMMIEITIIISISVKPRSSAGRLRFLSSITLIMLPILVLSSVQACAVCLAVNIKNVLAAPGFRRGIVAGRTQSPLIVSSHGINGNAAQEPQLLPLDVYSLDQGIQIRRIAIAIHFN